MLADKEGKEIAQALGTKKAAFLQNHGLLTVGNSIEAAVFWFVSLEKCCQAQLMADAAAGGRGHETIKIGDEEAAFTYQVCLSLAYKDFQQTDFETRMSCLSSIHLKPSEILLTPLICRLSGHQSPAGSALSQCSMSLLKSATRNT